MGETVYTTEDGIVTANCPHDNTFVVRKKASEVPPYFKKKQVPKEVILEGEPQTVDFFEKETKKSKK